VTSWSARRRRLHVLLDLDGTLTDSRVGIVECLKHALTKLGYAIPSEAELVRYIGPPLQDTFARLLGRDDARQIAEAIALYRERYGAEGMFENSVYAGIDPALSELRSQGATLYVATSKLVMYAERILQHFSLRHFFRAVYGSEPDGTRVDKSELIGHVLTAESLPRDATYMVGDRSHDVAGALANGVMPIGVLWGYGSREELTAAGATALCEKPSLLWRAVSLARQESTPQGGRGT
jgi:phosphoglycolate phosphatase